MDFHLAVGLIREHSSEVDHPFGAGRYDGHLFIAAFGLPDGQGEQLAADLVGCLL